MAFQMSIRKMVLVQRPSWSPVNHAMHITARTASGKGQPRRGVLSNSSKGEGYTTWQVTANEWICSKKLKAPRNMVGCQKTFKHQEERKKNLLYFTVIFLTFNLASAMSL